MLGVWSTLSYKREATICLPPVHSNHKITLLPRVGEYLRIRLVFAYARRVSQERRGTSNYLPRENKLHFTRKRPKQTAAQSFQSQADWSAVLPDSGFVRVD